jgi:epoxyqueuosine reductase
MDAHRVKTIARAEGFELAGIAPAIPLPDMASYRSWVERGMAADMGYLVDYRMDRRSDPRELLPTARSILCVGKLYNTPHPYSTELNDEECGWISRYAWGEDYHQIVTEGLRRVEDAIRAESPDSFESKICVDTAPLLERSYARMAGLGWIGKNTCLINEGTGSWYFLGSLLLSLPLDPDTPPADRCGSCTACIDNCPTKAIVPASPGSRQFHVDSRACISYYTIEKKREIPEAAGRGNGHHVFGCDICQDVCPWNRKASVTEDFRFNPKLRPSPPLAKLAEISEQEFREVFRNSPVSRSKYVGFLRNVVIAMGNSGNQRFLPILERLSHHETELIASHAEAALLQLQRTAKATSIQTRTSE